MAQLGQGGETTQLLFDAPLQPELQEARALQLLQHFSRWPLDRDL
jgi:hypothetical protein